MTPDIPELGQIFIEINAHHPRAAAVLAFASMESGLRYAISTRFVLLDPNYFDTLLDAPGPMATFYAMVELGFALGLYGPLVQADLHTIRRIRNGFAHAMKPISFETPEVTNETKMLKYLDWMKSQKWHPIADQTPTLHDMLGEGMIPWPQTEREKYTTICRLLTEALLNAIPVMEIRLRDPALP